jgi:hypothetical protein
MIGTNLLHLHERATLIATESLSQSPSGCITGLLSSFCEQLGETFLCYPMGLQHIRSQKTLLSSGLAYFGLVDKPARTKSRSGMWTTAEVAATTGW